MGEVGVQFLGSGDAFGSGGRFQTCIYVRSDATRFLIDCRASPLIATKRFGMAPSLVETILLTHLHGDHFGGLPFFIMARFVSGRRNPLTVAGPPGLEARIFETMEVLFPGSSEIPRKFDLKFVEIEEGSTVEIGPTAVPPLERPYYEGWASARCAYRRGGRASTRATVGPVDHHVPVRQHRKEGALPWVTNR